jgi:hypothetical protein
VLSTGRPEAPSCIEEASALVDAQAIDQVRTKRWHKANQRARGEKLQK